MPLAHGHETLRSLRLRYFWLVGRDISVCKFVVFMCVYSMGKTCNNIFVNVHEFTF
jgi:hypothetical protein